jgi:hypothetical protein
MILEFINSQPPYLTENWLNIMATAEDRSLRLIKVSDGVLSITNKGAMVRTELPYPPYCPDGFYRIAMTSDESGKRVVTGVVEVENSPVLGTYPDIDRVKPNIKNLAFQTIMLQSQVAFFMAFCQEVASIRGQVCIEGRYAYCFQDKKISFGFDFNTPVCINCSGTYLLQAVKECSKYPSIYITRENLADSQGRDRNMPLILGNGWRNCAMVGTILY